MSPARATSDGTVLRLGARVGSACACGGFIVSAPEWAKVRLAIDKHSASGRHQEWRMLREAAG
jgi:hypothetical protein